MLFHFATFTWTRKGVVKLNFTLSKRGVKLCKFKVYVDFTLSLSSRKFGFSCCAHT